MAHAFVLVISFLTGVAVIGLLSLGLALVFTTRGIINLAHGEFVMVGAYTTVTLTQNGVPFILTLPAAAVVVAAAGWLLDVVVIRRLDRRPTDCMLATWGVSLILSQAVLLIFGTSSEGLAIPLGSFEVGTYTVARYNLVLVAAFVASLVAVAVLMKRSSTGLFIRATAQSPVDAGTLGVDTRRVKTLAFTASAAFTGLAGGLLAPFLGISPTMGQTFIAKAFMAVIVGGPDAVMGTALSSVTLGGTENILSTIGSPLVGQVGLLLLAIVLVRFAPRGITGGRS